MTHCVNGPIFLPSWNAREIVPHLGTLRSILRGLEDLSPESVARLEDELGDADGVRYASVLLEPRRGARGVSAPLVPSYLWLERAAQAGVSDGLVPTSSQARGSVIARLDTDHWGAIGWAPKLIDSPSFDASAFYEWLAVHLAADEALETFDHKH